MTPEQQRIAETIIFVVVTIGAAVWNRIKGNERLDALEQALIDRIEGKTAPEEPPKQ